MTALSWLVIVDALAIALALGIKGAFLLLTLQGAATMGQAVFADMGTSLLVIANGPRLLRGQSCDQSSGQPARLGACS